MADWVGTNRLTSCRTPADAELSQLVKLQRSISKPPSAVHPGRGDSWGELPAGQTLGVIGSRTSWVFGSFLRRGFDFQTSLTAEPIDPKVPLREVRPSSTDPPNEVIASVMKPCDPEGSFAFLTTAKALSNRFDGIDVLPPHHPFAKTLGSGSKAACWTFQLPPSGPL